MYKVSLQDLMHSYDDSNAGDSMENNMSNCVKCIHYNKGKYGICDKFDIVIVDGSIPNKNVKWNEKVIDRYVLDTRNCKAKIVDKHYHRHVVTDGIKKLIIAGILLFAAFMGVLIVAGSL